ncbi:hypothetical protein F8M41_018762 [Gigaspora margarita]|uniref:F-box domain-containing protein n=1 Tax=Gigaspora margarita TaxID=4874 RepID=A0A8H4AKZ6_GIGMA|nr:hypothetical protein F8M41_018762 [Gigaspora margarita]
MASKMLMGDMPELMEIIFNNLNNEFYSLYSCALVSRHWCKMTIPILWQNPFSFGKNSLFISQYVSSLDENEKLFLKTYEINVNFANTLFNYARFLKVLNSTSLEWKVQEWIDFQLVDSKPYASAKCLIINLLFNLFIKGRNELFFSRLQDLSFDLFQMSDLNAEHLTVLLKILAKNTTKINVLKIEEFCYIHEPRLVHALECFIKSQEQLKQFRLLSGSKYSTEFHGIISALESQSKSLKEVKIVSCVCNTEFKMLMNCKNLEILRIKDCKNVNVLRASLDTLKLTSYSNFYASNIVQILKESGTLLQRLSLVTIDCSILEELLLLETLKSFCPNLTYLNLTNVEFSTQFSELIGNLQKLQFLTLEFFEIQILEDELEILVMQFAELLPLTLQYLDLRNSWFISYIDIFLNNCHAPLKYLLIDHIDDKKTSKSLTEFCIRKKTLKYVGLNRYSSLNDSIKKELEGYIAMVPNGRIIVNC